MFTPQTIKICKTIIHHSSNAFSNKSRHASSSVLRGNGTTDYLKLANQLNRKCIITIPSKPVLLKNQISSEPRCSIGPPRFLLLSLCEYIIVIFLDLSNFRRENFFSCSWKTFFSALPSAQCYISKPSLACFQLVSLEIFRAVFHLFCRPLSGLAQ